MSFSGKHICKLDSKGRIFIPSKFRKNIEENRIFITRGFDINKCLNIYKIKDWKEFESKLMSLPINNEKARNVLRYYLGLGKEVDVDIKGRIKLPNEMIESIGINSKVIALGLGDRIELWADEQYQEMENKMFENIIQDFNDLEL